MITTGHRATTYLTSPTACPQVFCGISLGNTKFTHARASDGTSPRVCDRRHMCRPNCGKWNEWFISNLDLIQFTPVIQGLLNIFFLVYIIFFFKALILEIPPVTTINSQAVSYFGPKHLVHEMCGFTCVLNTTWEGDEWEKECYDMYSCISTNESRHHCELYYPNGTKENIFDLNNSYYPRPWMGSASNKEAKIEPCPICNFTKRSTNEYWSLIGFLYTPTTIRILSGYNYDVLIQFSQLNEKPLEILSVANSFRDFPDCSRSVHFYLGSNSTTKIDPNGIDTKTVIYVSFLILISILHLSLLIRKYRTQYQQKVDESAPILINNELK